MAEYEAVAVFCEDIRREAAGTDTIVGILPDRVIVPKIPGAIPKLYVYARAHVFEASPGSVLVVRLLGNDNKEYARHQIDAERFQSAVSKSKTTGINYTGFIVRIGMAPFVVNEPEILKVLISIDDDEKFIGSFSIVEDGETTTSNGI
jgi:hypothetical protein